jgi:hypothetical protein
MVMRFGPFVLDAARRQLFRDDTTVHLTPKAFDLLFLLVDAAPRVLSKGELHERLWPGTYVSDATLVGLVKELRRALGSAGRIAPWFVAKCPSRRALASANCLVLAGVLFQEPLVEPADDVLEPFDAMPGLA